MAVRMAMLDRLKTANADEVSLLSSLWERFKKTQDSFVALDVREEALRSAEAFVSKDRFKFRFGHPWEDSNGVIIWSAIRTKIGMVILSRRFEVALVLVILCNLVVMIYETNLEANCYPEYKGRVADCPDNSNRDVFANIANGIFLCIYTIEAATRIYVERFHYFKQKENLLDFGVCVSCFFAYILDSFLDVAWLRVLRVFRLLRVFDIIATVPELRMICVGFAGSMRAIFFGTVLILAMLTLASILLVQYIHPISSSLDFGECDRCSRGFASVQSSVLTLYQQIVAGDSWGTINVPVIEENWYLGIALCVIQLVVGIGAMNLILAVVVDRAVEAREANKDRVMHEKLKDQTDRKVRLLQKIAQMDYDSSGMVSKDEIRQGILEHGHSYSYEIHRAMILADVTEEDLLIAFDFLEQNHEGEISYLQLCDVLDEFQSADVRKLTVLSKLHINKLEKRLIQQSQLIERLDAKLDRLTISRKLSRGSEFSSVASNRTGRTSRINTIPARKLSRVPSNTDIRESGHSNSIGVTQTASNTPSIPAGRVPSVNSSVFSSVFTPPPLAIDTPPQSEDIIGNGNSTHSILASNHLATNHFLSEPLMQILCPTEGYDPLQDLLCAWQDALLEVEYQAKATMKTGIGSRAPGGAVSPTSTKGTPNSYTASIPPFRRAMAPYDEHDAALPNTMFADSVFQLRYESDRLFEALRQNLGIV